MIRVAHATAWFPEETKARVLALMRLQCSALRSAYQARQRGLSGNGITRAVKQNYMEQLNQRYIVDAVKSAGQIRKHNVVFGGRKAWEDFRAGRLSKEEWQQRRNGQLYSRGDRAKKGNPNIRVVGSRILVNDPTGRGLWLEGKFYLPEKFRPDWSCYSVRLLYRSGRFDVKIVWSEETTAQPACPGAIGLDVNPDGVAVVETAGDGNLMTQHYESEQRIRFAAKAKRDNDMRLLARRVVEQARLAKKPVVLEDLKFRRTRAGRKFNRMRHNFVYRRLTEAITQAAEKAGIRVIKVNPAFTSVLGLLKYARMYSLNRHTAAALVIARRGQGFVERQNFAVTPDDACGERLTLEGRGCSQTLSPRAYSWLQDCFLRPKPSQPYRFETSTGVRNPAQVSSSGETPDGEALSTTGRQREHTCSRRKKGLLPKSGMSSALW